MFYPEAMKRRTLCWDCAKACGDCSWSRQMEQSPVEGWNAVPTKIKLNREGEETGSYLVIECPEFVRDAWNGGALRLEERA